MLSYIKWLNTIPFLSLIQTIHRISSFTVIV